MYKIPANTLFVGKVVHYMPSCHSTNDSARELSLKSAISEGTVVITDHQTHGKGQRGNVWQTKRGENLTFSIILTPNFLDISKQFYLNMISSLAVQAVIQDLLPEAICMVKWPNDVYLNGKKVAGILIENTLKSNKLDTCILGIGLNVNQLNFPIENATSLSHEFGKIINLQLVFESLMHQVENFYLKLKSFRDTEIKEKYLQHLLGFREKRLFRSEIRFEGEIMDVLESGHLKVKTSKGEQLFDFKEIEFVWK